jgi:hypothetical protein
MNSTKKTILPIALLIAMIFGITYMSQFTATTKNPIESEQIETELPLKTGSAELKFDPFAPDHLWYHRFFAGNFEVGTDGRANRIGFFIQNPRKSPVRLTALTPSCSTCTSARAAAIPAEALRNYRQHVAATGLPMPRPLAGDLITALAWAELQTKLRWHEFAFNDHSNFFELSGSTESDGESWGIVELGFKVDSVASPGAKAAFFDVYDVRGNKLAPEPFPFMVHFGGRDAMEVNATDFRLSELSESNPVHGVEVYCVSATRDQLPPPVAAAEGNDAHVVIGKPIPLGPEELLTISRSVSAKAQASGVNTLVQFRSGYRIQVVVHREANGKALDIGPYEKIVNISAGPGVVLQKPIRIHLHGDTVGAVRLEGVNKVDFGSYNGDFLQKKEVRIWTERKGIELEIDPKLCEPSFLKPAIGKPESIADRTYWTLSVQIPAREGKRPPWEGFIYLRSKGEKPFNLRIPVSGHGR